MSDGFNIEFDFRLDVSGFFDNPAAREALERAAEIWESLIVDEFTDVAAGVTLTIRHPGPSAPDAQVDVTLDQPIDDLLIFVGADTPPFGSATGALAAGGFAGGRDLNDLMLNRVFGPPETDRDFEPFAGQISVDPSRDWDFSLDDPPEGGTDFVSVMLHEIGHILGFGQAPAFEGFFQAGEGSFGGRNTLAVNGGPVPLEADGAHIQDGFEGNATLMDPTSRGGRTLPTEIDLAMLSDIGLEVAGFDTQNRIVPVATPLSDRDGEDTQSVLGGAGADILDGLAGNDTLAARAGDDLLIGGGGDDELFGEAGADTFLIRPGDGEDRINDFDVGEDILLVSPEFGLDGAAEVLASETDNGFSNVQRLQLDADTSVEVFFGIGSGDRLSAADIRIAPDRGDTALLQDVAELYIGYFGRAPDPGGFDFWAGEIRTGLDAGSTRTEVLEDVSESFRLSDEAQALFPFLAPEAADAADRDEIETFVIDVFGNLFDRRPGIEGLRFWADTIESRVAAGINIGDIIVDIASGAQDTGPFGDAATLSNRAEAARFYAAAFGDAGVDWTLSDDGEGAREIVKGVTGDVATLSTAAARTGSYLAADQETPSMAVIGTPPDDGAALT